MVGTNNNYQEGQQLEHPYEPTVQSIEVRQSLWILVGKYLLFYLVFTLIAVFLFVVREMLITDVNYIIALLILHVFALIVMFTLLFQWVDHRYLITSQKIVQMSGVIFQREKICAVRNIESVTLSQSIFQKLFQYGTVKLYAPTHDKVIFLKGIPHPERYAAYIDAILPKTHMQGASDNNISGGVAVIRL